MAVLLNEGLIKLANGKTRNYTCSDPTAFITAIQALIDSEVSLEEAPPQAPSPKRKNKKVGP